MARAQIGFFTIVSLMLVHPVLATDPNSDLVAPKLEFAPNSESIKWPTKIKPGHEKAAPSHVAEFYIDNMRSSMLKSLQKMPSWKTLSERQRQFCQSQRFYRTISTNGTSLEKYIRYQLFAVSAEDAKKLVQVCVERKILSIQEDVNYLERILAEYEQKIRLVDKELPIKKENLKSVEQEYSKLKRSDRYSFLTDVEASSAAKDTILRMKVILDELDIQLAELRARLKAIDRYKARALHDSQNVSNQTSQSLDSARSMLSKLEQMEIELMINLSGFEAKREAIHRTISIEKRFRELYIMKDDLSGQVRSLESSRSSYQRSREKRQADLEDPKGDLRVPEIFQNKVTIHPVHLEFSR
jgi:hypothetical protein